MTDPHPAFDERLSEAFDAANRQHGMQRSAELTKAMNALAAVRPKDDTAGPAIATALSALISPTGAGHLAAGVENGADPELTCQPIIDTFLKWSRTISTLSESDENRREAKPDADTIAGLQLLGQAIVAHVARLPEVRKLMRDTAGIRNEIERIAHLSFGARWLEQLLTQCSGQLIVLNTAKRVGVLVRYSNISNCFHLFTLLQGALAKVMPDAREVDTKVQDIARGRQHGKCSDAEWWHYSQPNVSTAALAGMVWGEMPPSGIARIDGEQVLLLWPAILNNHSWDGGFFSPILQASLPGVEVLRALPDEEVSAWWKKLKLPEPHQTAGTSWWRKLFALS